MGEASRRRDEDCRAVVLNWNRSLDTIRAVRSLLAQRPVAPGVIVVDNGSSPEEVARLREAAERDGFDLVEIGENRGFAGGMNRGIDEAFAAGAKSVLLVNNDVVCEPDCLAALRSCLEREEGAGAVGPLVLDAGAGGERIWAAGGRLRRRENLGELLLSGRTASEAPTAPREVDFLPGCVLLLRRRALEAVGRFDESFFCYMEDVDLALRLRDAGWKSVLVPEARALHAPGSSTGGPGSPARKYMMAANAVRLLRRHGAPADWAAFLFFDVALWPLAYLRALALGEPRAALAKAHGLFDGLRGVPVTPERFSRYLPAGPA